MSSPYFQDVIKIPVMDLDLRYLINHPQRCLHLNPQRQFTPRFGLEKPTSALAPAWQRGYDKALGWCVNTNPTDTARYALLCVTRVVPAFLALVRCQPDEGLCFAYIRLDDRSIRHRTPAAPRQESVSCGQLLHPVDGSMRRVSAWGVYRVTMHFYPTVGRRTKLPAHVQTPTPSRSLC